MAQRRMFSPQIVASEEFLTMPVSSQALYFHLGMNADDDGFIQPKITMRTVGSNEDDLKVLLTKRFLIPFESGVVVIKHWLIHNLIQKDRYHPTRFIDEKNRLFIKENKAYTENPPSVNKMLTEVRLGKDRLGKILPAKAESKHNPVGAEILKAFEAVDPKNKTYYGNTTQRKACDFLLSEYGLDKVLKAIAVLPEVNKQKLYVAQVTTPYELQQNWVKLGNAMKQKLSTKKIVL